MLFKPTLERRHNDALDALIDGQQLQHDLPNWDGEFNGGVDLPGKMALRELGKPRFFFCGSGGGPRAHRQVPFADGRLPEEEGCPRFADSPPLDLSDHRF